SFLICIPLAFYYQLAERTVTQTGIANPAFKMTFGQMSEVFFMLVMPLFFARLGVKWMLAVGMLAWVVRYALFAVGAPDDVQWMVLLGVALHGICYDFFFVTGQIYTDKAAPPAIRSQAQGMLVLFTLGLGMLIGAKVAGEVEQRYTPAEYTVANEQALAAALKAEELTKQVADAPEGERAALETQLAEAQADANAKNVAALKLLDWKMIWGIPAGLAGAILLMFVAVFKDKQQPAVEQSVGAAPAT
ncbi:MAG: MFS transporter, partial [Planctomycetales bacterium]|nr:MFS transporter [Planctomycetales bacterium]